MAETAPLLEGQLKTIITAELIESMKLAALPSMELRERIFKEAEENPALEITFDPIAARELAGKSEYPLYRQVPHYPSGEEKSNAHMAFVETALTREETLQEHLNASLAEVKLCPKERELARSIISSLDSNGFLVIPSETLPGAEDARALEKALSVVQRLDPIGCAAKDTLDSLAIQAKIYSETSESDEDRKFFALLASILSSGKSLFEKAPYSDFAQAIKRESGASISAEDAKGLYALLQTLEPFPGRNFAHGDTTVQGFAHYIIPDIIVVKKDDLLYANINDDEMPVVKISQAFENFKKDGTKGSHKDKKGSNAEKNFVKESVRNAMWFIGALKRRRKTLAKVASAIVARQRLFFERGPKFLQPMRMIDIAHDLEFHEATVSRAVSGKYLQCEWGVFSLKYFFSSSTGTSSADGVGNSKESVKEIIREILANSEKKLSDRVIAEKLAAQGISIARRTVAKYRAEMQK